VKNLNLCLGCGKEIPATTSTYKRKYCSDECAGNARVSASIRVQQEGYNKYIADWKSGKVSGARGEGVVSWHIRRFLFEKFDSKCCECGWSKINPTTGKIPLEIEHIDGDWNNHKEVNLKLLCPNCHSLTPTYRSLNKGRGRKVRLSKLQNGR
jgi:hypothetical protein